MVWVKNLKMGLNVWMQSDNYVCNNVCPFDYTANAGIGKVGP